MIKITDNEKLFSFCRALASPIRIQIISILSKSIQNGMSMNEIATELGITNGALTPHISYLEKANIIYINSINGKHGIQKKCFLKEMEYNISFYNNTFNNTYETELPIGSYNNYSSTSICGLATSKSIIGLVNDPRYFDDPTRMNADILWFTNGFLEYRIPNYLQPNQKLSSITISQEINQQNLTEDNNPSELIISLNNKEFPVPYPSKELEKNQSMIPNWLLNTPLPNSGVLYTIALTQDGIYINDQKYGKLTISDLDIIEGTPILYQIKSNNCTGILYGMNIGNHPHGITVEMHFENE